MIIAGAKGFAKELLQVYYRDYSEDNIYLFDNINNDINEFLYDRFRVLRNEEELARYLINDSNFSLGVGTPKARRILYNLFIRLNGSPQSIISKKSNIGFFGTEIDDCCSIVDGVSITNDVKIRKGTLVNLNATIGHDTEIGEFCDINPGVNISGHCTIGNYCSIGTNATILPGIRIGRNVTIGAGTVVTKDIPDNCTVVGVPGKIIKQNFDI